MILDTDGALSRVGTPSATFVSPNQIWLAYTGRLEEVPKGKGNNYNNDIYVKRGTIQEDTAVDGTVDWDGLPDDRVTLGPESDAVPSIL